MLKHFITVDDEILNLAKKGRKAPFYTSIQPMLATLVDKAFDNDDWTYEVKWDGYRAVGFINGSQVDLKSRNDKSFNIKYYPVFNALKEWGVKAVVDGEIVVIGSTGNSNFNALQNWRSEADGELIYYLFDILWYDGTDIKDLPLTERKAILASIIPANPIIRYSNDFETSGIEFLEMATKMGLEGIMAKKKTSRYHTGIRTKEWLKIKANKRQEVVIGGYTINDDSRKLFSSLLVGVFNKDHFLYIGRIGTGFDTKTQKSMMEQFRPFIIDDSPFQNKPDVNQPSRFRPNPPHASVTWLKPELVCEVSFRELTPDGVMRHPSFEGMRNDKKADSITLERETPSSKIVGTEQDIIDPNIKTSKSKKSKQEHQETNDSNKSSKQSETVNKKQQLPAPEDILEPYGKSERKSLLNPSEKSQVKSINGHQLKFTNLDKLYWPDEKISKRDMINYYYRMAPYILPYIYDKPMTLKRYPNGIKDFSFYQKDVKGKVPEWVKTCHYYSEADQEDKKYMLVNDEAALLLMASLGAIELHPWSSSARKPDYPTWCIIDLDPGQTTFEQVIDAALVTKDILDDLDIPAYCKTSGSTGIHIYIPLEAKYTYEQSKEFARVIATLVHEEIPEFTSIERKTVNRDGKMYVDFLQNRPHATVAAPYSLRPKPGAPVSMPLHWHEVKRGLKVTDFNIHNAIERVMSEGDIFKPVLDKGIDLENVVKNLGKRM